MQYFLPWALDVWNPFLTFILFITFWRFYESIPLFFFWCERGPHHILPEPLVGSLNSEGSATVYRWKNNTMINNSHLIIGWAIVKPSISELVSACLLNLHLAHGLHMINTRWGMDLIPSWSAGLQSKAYKPPRCSCSCTTSHRRWCNNCWLAAVSCSNHLLIIVFIKIKVPCSEFVFVILIKGLFYI